MGKAQKMKAMTQKRNIMHSCVADPKVLKAERKKQDKAQTKKLKGVPLDNPSCTKTLY
jgi:hypothetical protein